MIAAIRQYFDDAVKRTDPDLEFIEDPFGEFTVNDVVAEKFYKLYFKDANLSRTGNYYTEQIGATLEIYSSRRRDRTAAFDEAYEKALLIKDQVITPTLDKNNMAFTEILANSASPESLPNTDNSIKIVVEFTIRRDLKFC